MGDEKIDINDGNATPNGDPQPAAGAAGSDEASSAEPAPAGSLDDLTAEIAALKDQVLRSQAEAENTRRRAARDVENAHKFALEKFAGELLPVIDSLEKGLEATADAGSEEAEAIREGVVLSLKLFLDVLEKSGVSQVDPVGQPFDPQLHEAMAMVESPDAEPGSVLDVMQKGYTLNGRLIRAAMVVVSKEPAGGG
jgi:molecular chaperone GrpE